MKERLSGRLVASLRAQDYPAELLDIYVLADNSTDGTARAARQAGATAFERFNPHQVGKGYALDELISHIRMRRPLSDYDAFLVFDADNIVDPHFVSAMDQTFAQGCDVLTSYPQFQNFASSWISASSFIWFLREGALPQLSPHETAYQLRHLRHGLPSFLQNHRENGGWPYHLLTEDIQFSAVCAANGWRIGYCDDAIVCDEQPVTFAQSWRQRMRWAKGFYQVNAHCGASLARVSACPRRFSCYDMLMTIAPCVLLTIAAVFVNLFCGVTILSLPPFLADFMLRHVGRSLLTMLLWSYGMMFVYGLLTLLAEWRRIPASPLKKVMYLPSSRCSCSPIFRFPSPRCWCASVEADPAYLHRRCPRVTVQSKTPLPDMCRKGRFFIFVYLPLGKRLADGRVPIAWQSTVAPETISTSALWLAMIAPTYSASCSSVMSMLSRPPVISMFSILPPVTVMETSILSCRPSRTPCTPSAASARAGRYSRSWSRPQTGSRRRTLI